MKKFISYVTASIIATIMGLPYIMALVHGSMNNSPLPTPILMLLIIVQTTIIISIATFFGLKLAERIRLNSDFKLDFNSLKQILKIALPLGIVTGLAISLGDKIFSNYTPQISTTNTSIDLWKIILIAPYGGLVEEILLRLFVVSLLFWVLGKLSKTENPATNSTIAWISIALAAVIFGLGHLPATAAITTITPLIVLRAIILNGIGGLVFGWLYWKKGLQYSIIAHFVTDLVLLVFIPFISKL
jgi:membrane protease YdiL (CAAX protease family)